MKRIMQGSWDHERPSTHLALSCGWEIRDLLPYQFYSDAIILIIEETGFIHTNNSRIQQIGNSNGNE